LFSKTSQVQSNVGVCKKISQTMYFKSVLRVPIFIGTILTLITAPTKSAASIFMPDIDRIILAVGQNVESVTNYVAATGSCPGGIMSYTSTANVEGLLASVNYGTGNIDAQYFVADPAYTNTVIQLGLYINGDLANIIAGLRTANIIAIGNWIKSAGRPVYLRIGYEFDGPWNALPPDQYIAAYRFDEAINKAKAHPIAAHRIPANTPPTRADVNLTFVFGINM